MAVLQLRQLDAWYREETERWNGEREHMSKTCAQLQQRHAQFQHELRRKDADFEKLQKQLASQLSGGKRGHGNSSSIAAGGKITTSSRCVHTFVGSSSGWQCLHEVAALNMYECIAVITTAACS